MNTYGLSHTILVTSILLALSGCHPVSDYNIAYFEAGGAKALEGKQLYFIAAPDPFSSPYFRMVSPRTTLPVDSAEHIPIDFSQADPFEIRIGPAFRTDRVYAASDGTISLAYPNTGNATLREHFSDNKISVLPMDARVADAEVRYDVSDDGLVITYLNVRGSTVQFHYLPEEVPAGDVPELRDIAITYEAVSDTVLPGVVGLPLPSLLFRGIAPFDPDQFVENLQVSDLCESTL